MDKAVQTDGQRMEEGGPTIASQVLPIEHTLEPFKSDVKRIPTSGKRPWSSADDSPPTKSKQGPHYTIGELLGVGGSSRVYNCADNDKLVIKKVEIGPNPSKEIEKKVEQIRNEIEWLKCLDHPRVVRCIDAYLTDTEFCMVLDNMSGGSLRHCLEEYGALDEDRCRKYTIQLLDGLAYLHKKKIIHRDLKGANILLDESGDIKICDFGLAKLMECSTMQAGGTNSCVGTSHWMAPEVVKGEHYGMKCDIWSLGCTLVEMLTAKPPWSDLEEVQVMFKIAQGSPPNYTRPEGLSEAARDFIELCFKSDPHERPSSVELMEHRFVKGYVVDQLKCVPVGHLSQLTTPLKTDAKLGMSILEPMEQGLPHMEQGLRHVKQGFPHRGEGLHHVEKRLKKMETECKDQKDSDEVLKELRGELKDTYLRVCSRVQPIPWVEKTLPLQEVFIPVTLRRNIQGSYRQEGKQEGERSLEMDDIFRPPQPESPGPRRVRVEGTPGKGKSTLCQMLAYSWAQGVEASSSELSARIPAPFHDSTGSHTGPRSTSQMGHHPLLTRTLPGLLGGARPRTDKVQEKGGLYPVTGFALVLLLIVRNLVYGDVSDNLLALLVGESWRTRQEELRTCLAKNCQQIDLRQCLQDVVPMA